MINLKRKDTLRNEDGAFDLPSILTGVVAVGVLTAGVLGSIFGVIPFAQDNGAKQDLSAIKTAQGVAKTEGGNYLGLDSLNSSGLDGQCAGGRNRDNGLPLAQGLVDCRAQGRVIDRPCGAEIPSHRVGKGLSQREHGAAR